jgi:ABC-2 type transport system permease protein
VSYADQCFAAARLDFAEVLRSRWILFCAAVYAVLAGVLVLVGMRESALLGFTGMGRVLLSFSHALVLVLPLLALTATGQVIGRARDDGSLELLLTQPIRRSAWLVGVTLVRFAVLLAPLAVLIVAMAIYAQTRGQPIPWDFVGRVLAVSAALLWAFVGIGIAISVLVRNQARAITYVVLAWALAVALLDVGLIGLMLRWQLDAQAVFTLAALNPVQDARLALLSGLEPDLGTLGPVGHYLSTRIGTDALYYLGIGWPTLLGAIAWATALVGFRKSDIT